MNSRLLYDACSYATEIKESVLPLDYYLYKGKYENIKQCLIGDFSNILPQEQRADVENELFGLTRQNSKCPELKYNPNSSYKYPELSPHKLCESIYYITPTNITKPTTNMLKDINTYA